MAEIKYSGAILEDEKRILHINDIHTREKDFTTVRNYVAVLEKKLKMLIKLKDELKLYGIIINGDLSDGGYQDKVIKDSHMNYVRELAEGLEFCALNIGNHFFLERDSNIELYLIQPHDKHVMHKDHFAVKPVLSTPEFIVVDKVQFSLYHHSRGKPEYGRVRQEGIAHHVGIFHDEIVLPKSIRHDRHLPVEVTSNMQKLAFNDLDEAICAHIHMPFGTQYLNIDGKTVPLHIPGSFSITEYSDGEIHTHVKMPMHIVKGETIRTEFVEFPTLIEELRFVESQAKIDRKKELEHSESVFVADVVSNAQAIQYDLNSKKALMRTLTNKGYKEQALEVVRLAMTGELTKALAIQLHIEMQKQHGILT
jgi:hypothetical protein